MYEDIRSNKIRTGVIISIFIVVISLILYYICMAFDLGPVSIVIALTVSIISSSTFLICKKFCSSNSNKFCNNQNLHNRRSLLLHNCTNKSGIP